MQTEIMRVAALLLACALTACGTRLDVRSAGSTEELSATQSGPGVSAPDSSGQTQAGSGPDAQTARSTTVTRPGTATGGTTTTGGGSGPADKLTASDVGITPA